MYYVLCCDISTLRCTSAELELKLAEFSNRYHKASDNLWFYCVPRDKAAHKFISPDEYLITFVLHDYLTPYSIAFTSEIPNNRYYYELPQDAIDFLEMKDTSDD